MNTISIIIVLSLVIRAKKKKKNESEGLEMKGYKAFGKRLVCRGKQYAENTVFEEESAELCKSGIHFCENPLDTLDYYPLIDNDGNLVEVAEVEALDEVKTDGNKSVTRKLKIGAKLSLVGFIKASIDFLFEKADKTRKKDYSKLAASGYSSKLAASGDSSKLAASGDSSQLAASGDYSKLAASGDYSKLAASGKNSVVMCAGNNSKAKAKVGSWITLAEWKYINGEYTPVCVKTEQVDGKRIKEDVFYTLKNGEFVVVT